MCPDDEVEVNPFEIHVVEDPLQGRAVHAHWIERAALPRRPDATAVQNWDYYDGAIVGVGIRTPNRLRIYGSGVMIAPGVVLTASHTLNDHREAVSARTQEIQCLAIRRDGRAELWTAERWRWPESNSDISVLSVRLRTEAPDGWSCACLPITTRAPRDGETLSVVGFQFGAPNRNGRIGTIGDIPIIGQGAMWVSTGAVRKLWYPRRDPVRVSFPAIEIACDTLGGMSGGPVLDGMGCVVGLLSTGEDTMDGSRSYAAWILQAFMFKLDLVWPPGLYPPEPNLLDLPQSLIKIIGRNKVAPVGDQEIVYDYWQ